MEIYIGNEQIEHYEKYSVNSIFNALASGFSITIDSNLTDIEVMEEQGVIFKSNNQTVLTGVIKKISISTSTKKDTVTISGYSTGGAIQELHPKDTEYQYKDITLKEFSETLCSPHKIKVYFSPIALKLKLDEHIIKDIEFEQTDKIKTLLVKASRQLGLIVRHDERGGVLFTYPDVNDKTVADLNAIKTGKITYDTQNMYSEVKMYDVLKAGTLSVNPDVSLVGFETGIDVDRILYFKSSYADEEISYLEVLGKRGLLYQRISLTVTMEGDDVDMINNGWIDKPSGVLIAGDVITIQSDALRIKESTRFMVLKNEIMEDSKGVKSTLNLVPHEAFTNKKITKFWR